jgi:hypothetical protein
MVPNIAGSPPWVAWLAAVSIGRRRPSRLAGDGNIGWVRSGTVDTPEGQQTLQVGDAGDHPDIAYS